MKTNKRGAALIGLCGFLSIMLGGCTSTAPVKPQVRTAAAKPGNTYIIQRAAIRTPATDRLWQQRRAARAQQLAAKRTRLLAASRQQPSAAKPGIQPAAKPTIRPAANNTATARILRQQNLSRAQYHARYKARQQAAAKLKIAAARSVKPVPARKTLASHQPRVASVSRAQLARNKARLAQLKARQTQQHAQKKPAADPRQKYVQRWKQQQERQQAEKKLEAKKADLTVERVIHNAKKQIGTKYVWGGASPKTGFDCSGLVQHSIKQGAGVRVPRTAAEQYRAAVKVPSQNASRGDLVFFKTRGNSVSHVGIYLGDNKFVHAPRTGRKITTSKLSGYWKQRFIGFGRIPGACKVPV